ncbi:hypothetical protein B566_EDAN014641 [Ephemera danica]|nr:hypothetical protein B566_EDAN014641 [Ephemera danica]
MRGLLILPVVASVLGIATFVTGATLLVIVLARRILFRDASLCCSDSGVATDESRIEDSHPLKQAIEIREVKHRVQLTET